MPKRSEPMLKRFSVLWLLLWLLNGTSASALVPMDTPETVNHAIRYGMACHRKGLHKLLGPNWKETATGTLLNVYTPYMVLAAKAAKLNPIKGDDPTRLKEAKAKLQRELVYLKDPNNVHQVKFAVSMLGTSPTFAQNWEATLEGLGNGRSYALKPKKQLRPLKASKSRTGRVYEAVFAYYYNVSDVQKLEGDYTLVLRSKTGEEEQRFMLNNENLF
jgi:hypothetical protein